MSKKNNTLRIDEILLEKGLVTEEQVKSALDYQREHGGRLGSHLLHLGYIDESALCETLATQFGCRHVILSEISIPPEVIELIPDSVAVARRVVPFEYNSDSELLKIACEDPNDTRLIDELSFVAGGRKVQLYIAAECSLRSAITWHYSRGAAGVDSFEEGQGHAPSGSRTMASVGRNSVLLVSDDQEKDMPLRMALELESLSVHITDSADDAIEIVANQSFGQVFIRDTVQGDYIDLIDRLRKISPGTIVRFYESPARLLIDETGTMAVGDLMQRNLELFTSLLSSQNSQTENHAGTVGKYVDKLCRQMSLPERDRLTITNAAYLHDVSRYYYGESEQAADCCARIALTAKLLDSLNYSPLVIGMLRSMYLNLRQKYTRRLPIETLGGNILTIVDTFCENISADTKMSLDRFEAVRSNLESLSGKLFLPEVVKAFVEMMEGDILIEPTGEKFNQVLMYCRREERLEMLSARLQAEGFRSVVVNSERRFAELYARSCPDMIILYEEKAKRIVSLLDKLAANDVEIIKVPTFLVTSSESSFEPATLFERGIEDIFPIENSLELLVVKMRKLRDRAEKKATESTDTSTGASDGTLEEMNLIDLLQSLGPSGKTAKIRVISRGVELVLYFSDGKLVHAEGSGRAGAEAVYEGISWTVGKWYVWPINEEDLPESNIADSNEAVLMEGCRRLHSGQDVSTQ